MNDLRKAAKQAIDTLGYYSSVCGEDDQDTPAKQAQAALRAALAEPAMVAQSQYGSPELQALILEKLSETAVEPCKPLCELCIKRGYDFCANAAVTTLIPNPQPRKAMKLTSEEISQMWIDESFDDASHESCYMRGVRRGEAAFIAKNGLES